MRTGHVALKVKKEKIKNGGVALRRKACSWDHNYLLRVIGLGAAPSWLCDRPGTLRPIRGGSGQLAF